MRIFLLPALFLLYSISVKSQQIYLEAGKTISNFDFENSQGETLQNLQASDHTFISLGYRRNVFTKNLFLNVNANYNGYGSIGSDRALDNFFEWDADYLGLSLGLDYEVYKPGDFTFYIKGSGAGEFLVRGTQTLNNQVFDLSGAEDFDTPIYFFRAGLGVQFKVSDKLSVFTQYLYGKGGTFKNIPGSLKIETHNFGLGLLINIAPVDGSSVPINSTEIEQLKKVLDAHSQKIRELQASERKANTLQQEVLGKEQQIRSLKESISDALLPYKGNDFTVEERQGKLRIIMENDMLFNSGSWTISAEGENAVKALGNALAGNSEVSILIEGHTDDRPFKGSGNIKNNWDLSLKRATTIVEILRNNEQINPKNLTAAGKGEYDPIADNTTEEGRAKNRRIEVILTPKLDELIKLIKE